MNKIASYSWLALPHRLRLVALSSALALSACGGGGGSDATNTQPEPAPPPVVTNPQPEPSPPPVASKGNVSVLAGSLGGAGNLDGAGSAARFNNPWGLAVGPAGDLYVADTGNARVRKVTPAGVVSTVAGSGQVGCADGPAMQASFGYLRDVAVGPDTSVFVADSTRVRKIDPAGNVKTVTGATTGSCGNVLDSERIAPKRQAPSQSTHSALPTSPTRSQTRSTR